MFKPQKTWAFLRNCWKKIQDEIGFHNLLLQHMFDYTPPPHFARCIFEKRLGKVAWCSWKSLLMPIRKVKYFFLSKGLILH